MVNILLVDDNDTVRQQIHSFLRQQRSFHIDEARNGIEALSRVKHNGNYDIIALDVEMPMLNGIETLRTLSSMAIDAITIMVTSRKDFKTVVKAIRLGAYDYVSKPIDFDQLLFVIDRALEKKRLQMENRRLMKELKEINRNLSYLVEQRTRNLAEAEKKTRIYAGQLEKAYESLKSLDKMKSDFISLASHELKTPLVLISGYNEILLRKRYGELSEATEKALRIQKDNIAKLNKIVDEILMVNKLQTTQLINMNQTIDIHQLISDIISEYKDFCAIRQQSLETAFSSQPASLKGNSKLLNNAFANLLINAIKFTPDGGTIRIRTRHESAGARIAVIMEDTGIGIPQEAVDKVFDLFYEVKDVRHHTSGKYQFLAGGLGVGLTITKEIVEHHGGKIAVSSSLGKGSVFTVSLPLHT